MNQRFTITNTNCAQPKRESQANQKIATQQERAFIAPSCYIALISMYKGESRLSIQSRVRFQSQVEF